MIDSPPKDVWGVGSDYELYVGRWSRLVAQAFVEWLSFPAHQDWVDVGCGTGALSQTIIQKAKPRSVKCVDSSANFLEYAKEQIDWPGASFQLGDAQHLPFDTSIADVAVSGLVLNFIPLPHLALREMVRVVRPGGTIAIYVWDYAGKMELIRYFWNAAGELDSSARELDEGRRFPLCRPSGLTNLFQDAGLVDLELRPVDILTCFRDFEDYWSPFLGGQGPAPSYAMSLTHRQREVLRERIRSTLPFSGDGSISLTARAWAVRAVALI
jgi:SAM-dependent methyltransferase